MNGAPDGEIKKIGMLEATTTTNTMSLYSLGTMKDGGKEGRRKDKGTLLTNSASKKKGEPSLALR
jgi:hypothetical protein